MLVAYPIAYITGIFAIFDSPLLNILYRCASFFTIYILFLYLSKDVIFENYFIHKLFNIKNDI